VKRPLTAIAVSKLTKPGRYAVGHGVYLQITGGRGRSWVFRFEREYGGKRRGRHIGLGPCALVSLAEARRRASNIGDCCSMALIRLNIRKHCTSGL
jgi:Arm DNA-binding domain